MGFRIEMTEEDAPTKPTRVRFVGDLLVALPAFDDERILRAAARPIVFDFGELGRINSVGLRGLVRLCKDIASKTELTYERCVPQILEQFGMLPDFLRYGKVRSVLLSESCPLGHNQTESSLNGFRELKLGAELKLGETGLMIMPAFCRQCGQTLERDDVDEILFGFLKSMRFSVGQERAS